MKKWIIILLMVLVTIQISTALDECLEVTTTNEIPCMIISTWDYPNCNTTQALIYNETPTLVSTRNFTDFIPTTRCNFQWNITTKGSYFWNTTTGDTGRMVIQNEDDTMASLSVVVFILMATGLFFVLPFAVKRFSKHEWSNLIMKRSCWIVAIYLMMLNSTIVMNIASNGGLGIGTELFRYTWIFGVCGYLFMAYTILKTLFDLIEMHYFNKNQKRMGGDE